MAKWSNGPTPPRGPAGVSSPPPPVAPGVTDEDRRRFALAQAVKYIEGRTVSDATEFIIGMAANFEQYLKEGRA